MTSDHKCAVKLGGASDWRYVPPFWDAANQPFEMQVRHAGKLGRGPL